MKKRAVHIVLRCLDSPFDEENHPEIWEVFKGSAKFVAMNLRDKLNKDNNGYRYWIEFHAVCGHKGTTGWGS